MGLLYAAPDGGRQFAPALVMVDAAMRAVHGQDRQEIVTMVAALGGAPTS